MDRADVLEKYKKKKAVKFGYYDSFQKRGVFMAGDKTSLYILTIVGVVALVGIIVLFVQMGQTGSADLSGQAVKMAKVSTGSKLTLIDTDKDGLSDQKEKLLGTSPTDTDSDDDKLSDGWEVTYGFDPTDPDEDNSGIIDDIEDFDGDSLTNAGEEDHETDPHNEDTDDDEYDDGYEIFELGTDPTDADSDDDGYSDSVEVGAGTDPNTGSDYPTELCGDTDGGKKYETKGSVSGGTWFSTGVEYPQYTDRCVDSMKIQEYYCYDEETAYSEAVSCENVVGSGYTCSEADGACVSSSS